MGIRKIGLIGLLCCIDFIAFASSSRDSLISESLKNTRDPRVLMPLSEAMLEYDDAEMQARAYFVRGLALNYGAKAAQSAQAYKKALSYMHPDTVYDQRFTYAVVLKNLGIANYRAQEYAQGDSAFRVLRDYCLKKGDSLGFALAQKNRANAKMVREEYDSAVLLMKDAIAIYEAIDYQGIPLAYMSMGSIFGRMAQPQEAMSWFRMALARIENTPDRRLEGRIYNNMAVAYREMERLDSAQYYLSKALAIQEELGSVFDQVEIRGNLARNAIEMGDLSLAHENLDAALQALDERNPRASLILRNIWVLSLDLAIIEKQADVAKSWQQKLIETLGYKRIKNDYQLMERFAQYYELIGEQDSALAYLKAANELEEKIQRERDAEAIKKAANAVELIGLKSEKGRLEGRYRKTLTYGLILFGLSLIGLWIYWNTKLKKHKRSEIFLGSDGATFQFEDKSQVHEIRPGASESGSGNAHLKLKSKAVIPVAEIIYAQSEGHYVNLFLKEKDKPEVDRTSLKALQEELEGQDFQRIHRSYLVNCKHLKAVYATKVLLADGTELPVSRTYKEELQARFKEKREA